MEADNTAIIARNTFLHTDNAAIIARNQQLRSTHRVAPPPHPKMANPLAPHPPTSR